MGFTHLQPWESKGTAGMKGSAELTVTHSANTPPDSPPLSVCVLYAGLGYVCERQVAWAFARTVWVCGVDYMLMHSTKTPE